MAYTTTNSGRTNRPIDVHTPIRAPAPRAFPAGRIARAISHTHSSASGVSMPQTIHLIVHGVSTATAAAPNPSHLPRPQAPRAELHSAARLHMAPNVARSPSSLAPRWHAAAPWLANGARRTTNSGPVMPYVGPDASW